MDVVNELLQNIRFLKFYGWGLYVLLSCYISPHNVVEPNWEQKGRDARETELKWRVKENIVDTGISFIWYASLTLLQNQFSTSEIGHGCLLRQLLSLLRVTLSLKGVV